MWVISYDSYDMTDFLSRDQPWMTSYSGFLICSLSSMAFIIYGYMNPERIRTMIDELFKDQSETAIFITKLTKNFNQFWDAVQAWFSLAVNNFNEIWENLQNRIDKNVPSVELWKKRSLIGQVNLRVLPALSPLPHVLHSYIQNNKFIDFTRKWCL